ncbi:MAG: ABC transporter permease [Candidatus Korarchaeota archaeon]
MAEKFPKLKISSHESSSGIDIALIIASVILLIASFFTRYSWLPRFILPPIWAHVLVNNIDRMILKISPEFWDTFHRSSGGITMERFMRLKGARFGLVVIISMMIYGIYPEAFFAGDIRFHLTERLFYPSLEHPLGTDRYGRDVYSLIIVSMKYNTQVILLTIFVILLLGTAVGATSGYFGGTTDALLNGITDFFLVIPFLPLLLTLITIFNFQQLTAVILLVSVFSWMGIAKIIRANVYKIKGEQYIEAARLLGASSTRIIFKHILPNTMSSAIVNTFSDAGGLLLTVAALDFLGFGVGDVITIGEIVSEGRIFLSLGYWWLSILPGAIIALIAVAFNLVGAAYVASTSKEVRMG